MSFEVFTTFAFELTVKLFTGFFIYQADKNLAYAYAVYEGYKFYALLQKYMQLRSFLKSGNFKDAGNGVYISKSKKDKKDE